MKSRSRRANAGSGRVRPASFCGQSSVQVRRNHATGLTSAAVAAHPSRIASSGIAPPPANGSSTRGGRPPYASRMRPRNQSRSGLSSRFQCRTPPRVDRRRRATVRPAAFSSSTVSTTCPAIRRWIARRSSGSSGSGSSVAISAARHAASGRRAGQMCRVEMCPWRTFFSWTESRETCSTGKAASTRRFLPSVMRRTMEPRRSVACKGRSCPAARSACRSSAAPPLSAQACPVQESTTSADPCHRRTPTDRRRPAP